MTPPSVTMEFADMVAQSGGCLTLIANWTVQDIQFAGEMWRHGR